MKLFRTWVPVFLIVVAFFQCTPISDPQDLNIQQKYFDDENLYGHRWWNYYQRGLFYLESQALERAMADFEQAILRRKGDQRMARTYGMHFIDYFPNREKGIVLYRLGRLSLAEKYLKTSLNNTSSAKAIFYMDLVRKKKIEDSGGDPSLPVLKIERSNAEIWTNDDPVMLSGVAEDAQYLVSVRVGDKAVFMEGSRRRVEFKESINLPQGEHRIVISATNLLGGITRKRLVVHVDRQGPTITIGDVRFIETDGERKIFIGGSVYDAGGLSEFYVNGEKVPLIKRDDVSFHVTLDGNIEDIFVEARDKLGNRTWGRVALYHMMAKTETTLFACADSGHGGDFSKETMHLVTGLFDRKDGSPPTIVIENWSEYQTVLMDKMYIEGHVSDGGNIRSLYINNTPILRRKGRSIIFGYIVALKEGENSITIKATDEKGNTSVESITVWRRIPKAYQMEQRLSVAVLPFKKNESIGDSGYFFYDQFIDALVDRNRFRVVERDRLDFMFEEQKLSRSGLMDNGTALRLGRMLAAQSVVTGSIIETRSGVEIVARLIDTETSEILSTQDVYTESMGLKSSGILAEGLALKFHHDFPLVGGVVMARNGEIILTDLGGVAVKIGRRIIVYREVPVIHPVHGKNVGVDNEIIDGARIIQVSPRMSKARLRKNEAYGPKPLDRVVSS